MTTIPSIFNTGTGRSAISGAGSTIPSQVDNLVVLNDLTVNGDSFLESDVQIGNQLNVNGNTTMQAVGINGELVTSGNVSVTSIGSTTSTQFSLPPTTGTNGQVLSILDDTQDPQTTEWKDDQLIPQFVTYDTTTKELSNNDNGVASVIDEIVTDSVVCDEIGRQGQQYLNPTNTSTASTSDVLKVVSNVGGIVSTQWGEDKQVDDYVKYDNSGNTLVQVDSNGTETAIRDIKLGDLTGTNNGVFRLRREFTANGNTYDVDFRINNEFDFDISATTGGVNERLNINPVADSITIEQTSSTAFNNALTMTQTGLNIRSSEKVAIGNSINVYFSMPQNQPLQSDDVIKYGQSGTGTISDPYSTIWGQVIPSQQITYSTPSLLDNGNPIIDLNLGDFTSLNNGKLTVLRSDTVVGTQYNQVLDFIQNSILLQCGTNATRNTMKLEIDAVNETIEMSSNQTNNNIFNEVICTDDKVLIKSNNILLDAGGGYFKLPSTVPQAGQTIRFTGFGNGTVNQPYLCVFGV